jgi:hypothetical protein
MAPSQQLAGTPRDGRGTVANRTAQLSRAKGPLPYGYHNSFHTHASDATPPSYDESKRSKIPTSIALPEDDTPSPPPYSCSVSKSGVVGLMMEFRDPFMGTPSDKLWQNVYANLRGTQLTIHWVKFRINSKKTIPQPGKKIAQFSLQHAEVGLAVDVRPEENMPKNPVLNLLPSNVRSKLIKTKPQLFETQKEWLLRIRIEGFQFLMCLDSEELLLDWCEKLCTSIDIAPPIDDRTDPRYRSLPRRTRRQRQLENFFQDPPPPMTTDGLNNRLVEQQERILRTFYPNLANTANGDRSSVVPTQRPVSNVVEPPTSGDQDMDEFDPADVQEARADGTQFRLSSSGGEFAGYDSKRRGQQRVQPTLEAELRYRRRCMPIMYKYSPRSSEIIFYKGARWRIDARKGVLRSFETGPPRYPRTTKKGDASASAAVGATESTLRIIDTWQPRQLTANQDVDGNMAYRTSSRYSARVEDSDAISIQSVAGMTIGSAHDGIEPVSRVVSMFNPRDGIAEHPNSPDAAMMLKEKAMQENRSTRSEQVAHAFASLVL